MSTRVALTVREQGAHPEEGPDVKTLLNLDVVTGNKVAIDPRLAVFVTNTHATDPFNVTHTYDDDAGEVRTKVLALAAGEGVLLQLEARMGRHASDAAEHGYAWFTAAGAAGDVKYQAVRLRQPLGA